MRLRKEKTMTSNRGAIVAVVLGVLACSGQAEAGRVKDSSGRPSRVSSRTPHGNVALDWNAIAVDAIVVVGRNAPASSGLLLGMVQGAVYDATNSITRSHQPLIAASDAPCGSSAEAAVAQAAHDVLVALLPAQQSSLDAALASALARIPAGSGKSNGIAVGQRAASAMLANRVGDGRFANIPYTFGPPGPGVYQPTPPAFLTTPLVPWMAEARPFTMETPAQFRPEPPPDLGSQTWAGDLDRTRTLGDLHSAARTAAQTDIALFWTENTPQQWNRAIRGVASQSGLDLSETARLLALTNVAMADAWIGCWDGKYTYRFWRPVTAIRAGGEPGWTPLAVTPNHPEYPAAHGCVSAAAAEALSRFFDGDTNTFTMDSTVTGTTHTFARFREAGDEAGMARIYGGMHYLNSVLVGQELGRNVVDHLVDRGFFRQVDDDRK